MNFIDFLKARDEKLGQLKIKQALYPKDRKIKKVELHLLFPDKFGSMKDEEKDKVLALAKEFVDNKYDITIKYQKSYVDTEVVWDVLQSYFEEHLKFVDSFIKKENISVKQIEPDQIENKQNENYDCYNITLTIPKSLYDVFEQNNVLYNLIDYLQDKICANISITLDPTLQ